MIPDHYVSLRPHSQPSHRRLPRHAYGARQRYAETRWLLYQEPCFGRPTILPDLQQIHSSP